jgi:hypothetical protein
MLATSLLGQRHQASGPVPIAASPLFIVQQVKDAVQLQVARFHAYALYVKLQVEPIIAAVHTDCIPPQKSMYGTRAQEQTQCAAQQLCRAVLGRSQARGLHH